MDREKMRLLFSLEVVCWVAMFSTGEEGPEDGRGMESRDGLVSKQAQTPSFFSSFFFKSRSERWKSGLDLGSAGSNPARDKGRSQSLKL